MGHNRVVADAAVADAYVDSVNLAGPLDVHQPLRDTQVPKLHPQHGEPRLRCCCRRGCRGISDDFCSTLLPCTSVVLT